MIVFESQKVTKSGNGVVYFSGFSLTNGGKVIGSVNYKGEIDFKALDNQDSITTLIPVN